MRSFKGILKGIAVFVIMCLSIPVVIFTHILVYLLLGLALPIILVISVGKVALNK